MPPKVGCEPRVIVQEGRGVNSRAKSPPPREKAGKQPRGHPFGHFCGPSAFLGPDQKTLPRNTLLYKPHMAPPKFRKDQRSKGPGGPKGNRPKTEFRAPAKGGPKGHGPRGEFKGDFKGGSRGDPKSDFKKGDFKGGGHKTGFKGGKPPRPPGKPPFRAAPKKHEPPRPAPAARPQPERRPNDPGKWLYGLHAVQAALANPRRKLGRLLLTRRAAEIIGEERPDRIRIEIMEPDAIGKLLPPGAVHQGAALEAAPLSGIDLQALLEAPHDGRRRIVLVLDQLSDPHNVGAILRTAAAFGVTAVVVQDRHAPPQSGALAKAASGALDLIPYVEVVNIARALEKLAEHGFWRIALAGDGAQSLIEAIPAGDVALVLGSEGDGIRRLVREHCEAAAFIPIPGMMESLNVSNAAAIALYELRRA